MVVDLTVYTPERGVTFSSVQDVMGSKDVTVLDALANEAARRGATLQAVSYLAAYRIFQIYQRVDETRPEVLRRYLRWLGLDEAAPLGATGLRRYFNECVYGWSSYTAWVDDWVSGVPISRASAHMKKDDIEGWREAGASWETIMGLLAKTPMAGRDALQKIVPPEALPEGGMPEYLSELAELPPGQARKKVSEDVGEPQVHVSEARWVKGAMYLKVMLETSSGVTIYDLVLYQASEHESWMAIGFWLADRLGTRLEME